MRVEVPTGSTGPTGWRARHCPRQYRARKGATAGELAVMLPFLGYIFLVAIDYGRVFYFGVAVENAARAGALYGSLDAAHSNDTTGIQQAAQGDATNLSPLPTITSTKVTDADGNPEVQVTASYTFKTVVSWPGIPTTVNLTRTVAMRVLP